MGFRVLGFVCFIGGVGPVQAPRCKVGNVDVKLSGGELHFEVSGGRHIA